MSSKPRGMAIVINNKNFTCGMKDRVGTDRDAENLTKLFMWLGFYTNRYDNLTGKKMHSKLQVRVGGECSVEVLVVRSLITSVLEAFVQPFVYH